VNPPYSPAQPRCYQDRDAVRYANIEL